jgi:transcriptional regulator with XRE-family HTH domain
LRTLKEVREGLGLGVKRFADEAGVSTRTVQDTEGGKAPRRATAEKYAAALRRYGANPSQVREIQDALGETFTVDLDPYWRLREHTLRGVRETLIGLIRTGNEEVVRDLLDEVAAEYGQEGREAGERAEAEYWREVDQEQEGD